jgi:diamine N-acetyltransferase
MQTYSLPISQIGLLQPLWEGLRDHHSERTNHFRSYYEKALFEKRVASLFKRDQLELFICTDEQVKNSGFDKLSSDQIAAFLICSISGHAGEIDSLYVSPQHRGLDLGSQLLSSARQWLNNQGAQSIRLYVGDGNEDVLNFYQKNGFRVRATQMEWLDSLDE